MNLCVVTMRMLAEIRMRFSKSKVSSRCSTDKFVRASFLFHYALNNDERANQSRFPLTNAMWRVRGRLTLMLAGRLTRPLRQHRHAIFG